MTELKPGCVLWTKTADLAKDYGHEMGVVCTMARYCDRTRCTFKEAIIKTADQIEKLNTKQKLIELRQELANIK